MLRSENINTFIYITELRSGRWQIFQMRRLSSHRMYSLECPQHWSWELLYRPVGQFLNHCNNIWGGVTFSGSGSPCKGRPNKGQNDIYDWKRKRMTRVEKNILSSSDFCKWQFCLQNNHQHLLFSQMGIFVGVKSRVHIILVNIIVSCVIWLLTWR